MAAIGCHAKTRWMQVWTTDSLTALFALALLLGEAGLQLALVGSQAIVHLLLLLQLQSQFGYAAVQLRTPTQPHTGLSALFVKRSH